MVTDENALSYLHKKIRGMMNDLADHVAGGGVEDWAEYKKTTGIIEGLARAERELLDLIEKLTEHD